MGFWDRIPSEGWLINQQHNTWTIRMDKYRHTLTIALRSKYYFIKKH